MQGISSQSVVAVGSGLPVEPIDIGDFDEILGDLAPAVKTGAILQAQGNQYSLLFLPNRASVQVDVPFPEGAEAKLLDAMRFYLKEYAGPRSASALGHNFQGELDCGEASGREVLESLMSGERLRSVTMADPVGGTLNVFFVRGAETRGQLALAVSDDQEHVLEWAFNFNYDLRLPDSLDAFEVLDRFAESRALAEESVEAMQDWRRA